MVYIYVLQLENSKWYVGKTTNPEHRIQSHFDSNGSSWTQIHKPIKLHHLIPDCDDYDEDKYTKIYMDKYGINNVRGGSYVQVNLDDSVVEHLNRLNRGTNDKCFKCGKSGHFVKDCESNIDITNSVNTNNYNTNTNNLNTNNSNNNEFDELDTIDKINNKINELKEDLKVYKEYKDIDNQLNNIRPNNPTFKYAFEINRRKILDNKLIEKFGDFKKCIIFRNNRTRTRNDYRDDKYQQNETYWSTIYEVILILMRLYGQYITKEMQITEIENNLRPLFTQNNNNPGMFTNNNFNITQSEPDLDTAIDYLEIYFLELLSFVKNNDKKLLSYPDNYEKNVHSKIIQLNKKKLNLM